MLALPPGYFLDEPTWTKRDAELKLAQDLNTRLKAENDSFRKSANAFPLLPVTIASGIGVIAGVVVMLLK